MVRQNNPQHLAKDMLRNWDVPKHVLQELKPKSNDYCLCIPIINEGDRFKKQLQQIKNYQDRVDILILDGDSTDGSTDLAFLKRNGVRSLLIKKDTGKLSAQLRMGYAYALQQGYQGIITMDGNGKDDARSIPLFITKLKDGYDYIQGSRFIPGGKAINTPWLRHIANHYFHAPLISLVSGSHLTDTTNGFRAYSRAYLLDQQVLPLRRVFQKYELLVYLSARAGQIGRRVIEIPVTRRYPRGKVPTKIGILKGNFDLLITLFKAATGVFNP